MVLHSNFYVKAEKAFSRCVENLKVVTQFCDEWLEDAPAGATPKREGEDAKSALVLQEFVDSSLQGAQAVEEPQSDGLFAAAVGRRAALAVEPSTGLPTQAAAAVESSRPWVRAMRCAVVRTALFGGMAVSEDQSHALATVGKPSRSDLEYLAEAEEAATGGKAYVVYVSPKKALASPEANQWKGAIEGELGALIDEGTLRIGELTEVGPEDELLPALLLLNTKKDGRYKARLVACGNFQRAGGKDTHATVAAQEDWLTLIVIALRLGWQVSSVDVKTAFLQTDPVQPCRWPKDISPTTQGIEHRCRQGA